MNGIQGINETVLHVLGHGYALTITMVWMHDRAYEMVCFEMDPIEEIRMLSRCFFRKT